MPKLIMPDFVSEATASKIKQSLSNLNNSRVNLADAIYDQTQNVTQEEPINTITGKINRNVIVSNKNAIVTASGSVYKGDLVGVYSELKRKGDPLRVVLDDGVLLASDSINGVLVFLFSQDDNTYIKTAKWMGTEWHLGATELFLEGPLTQAVLKAVDPTGGDPDLVAVLYREEEMGCIQFWELGGSNGLTLTRRGTDLWSADSPRNVCAAWTMRAKFTEPEEPNFPPSGLHRENRLTIISQNEQGQTVVTGIKPVKREEIDPTEYLTANVVTTKVIEPGEYAEVEIPLGTKEAFVVPEIDTEEYFSRAWTISNHPFSGSILVTLPGADGKRYLLELYDYTDEREGMEDTHDYSVVSCHPLCLEGYLPSMAAVAGIEPGNERTGLFGGLSRTSGPNQKSALGAEIWSGEVGFTMEKPLPMSCGESDATYKTNIGLLSACHVGQGYPGNMTAVGYCAEEKYMALIWTTKGGGPAVEIADVGTAAELVTSGDCVALVYQRDHSVYLQQLETAQVVTTVTNGKVANGIAVTSGRPGQEIQYKSWR